MEHSQLMTVLEKHHQACWGWALHCCRGDREEAEEILQSCCLRVLDGKARFDGGSEFKTWFFAVIRNAASSRRRVAWRRLRRLRQLAATPSSSRPTAESGVYRSEVKRRLDKMLETLSARQRDVLHLVFYQEMTVEEAARAMGVSVGSARVHYHRAKQRLRKQWEQTESDYEPFWRQGNQSVF